MLLVVTKLLVAQEWNKDDPKTGRLSTDENITRVKQLVGSDRRLIVRMISDELSLILFRTIWKVGPSWDHSPLPRGLSQNVCAV